MFSVKVVSSFYFSLIRSQYHDCYLHNIIAKYRGFLKTVLIINPVPLCNPAYIIIIVINIIIIVVHLS